jgi:hypothetical protein
VGFFVSGRLVPPGDWDHLDNGRFRGFSWSVAMDQDVLVMDELDNGRNLVNQLIAGGFDVRLALWVNEADAGRWYLYLSSPVVDDKGPGAAYRVLLPLIEKMPEFGIDPRCVKLIGVNDTPAIEAQEVIRPKLANSKFATSNAKPFTGLTRFGGATFAGMDVGGVYIYPPFQAA